MYFFFLNYILLGKYNTNIAYCSDSMLTKISVAGWKCRILSQYYYTNSRIIHSFNKHYLMRYVSNKPRTLVIIRLMFSVSIFVVHTFVLISGYICANNHLISCAFKQNLYFSLNKHCRITIQTIFNPANRFHDQVNCTLHIVRQIITFRVFFSVEKTIIEMDKLVKIYKKIQSRKIS